MLSRVIHFMQKLLANVQYLSDCQLWWRCLKPRLGYHDWKMFSITVWPWTLTLTFQKLSVKFGRNAEYLEPIARNSDFYFSRTHNEHQDEQTNRPTDGQTVVMTWRHMIIAVKSDETAEMCVPGHVTCRRCWWRLSEWAADSVDEATHRTQAAACDTRLHHHNTTVYHCIQTL